MARAIPDQPGQASPAQPNEPDDDQDQAAAGNGVFDSIEVQELTPELASKLGVPSNVRGVVITRLGAQISGAQLRPGDVIEAINQNPVTSVQEYQEAIQSLDDSQPQVLSVCRQRSRSFVVVKPR